MKAEMILKTESPVHIGCGEYYLEMDFILKNNRIKFIDYDSLFRIVEFDYRRLEKLIKTAEQGEVKNKVSEIFGINEDKIPISKEIKFVGKEPKRSLKIQKHIQTNGKAYIPGSSIKGFIRTALLFKYLQDNPEILERHLKIIKEDLDKMSKKKLDAKKKKEISKNLEREVFGKEPTTDTLKYLKITDTSPVNETVVYEVRILGNPQQIPLYLECIPPQATLKCDIFIEEKFYETDGKIGRIDLDKIFEAVKCFVKELIRTEKEYRGYPPGISEFYRKIEGKDVLRLGHSTGYFSKTIGAILIGEFEEKFDELRKKIGIGINPFTKRIVEEFPKTRRITSGNLPIGWVSYEVKR